MISHSLDSFGSISTVERNISELFQGFFEQAKALEKAEEELFITDLSQFIKPIKDRVTGMLTAETKEMAPIVSIMDAIEAAKKLRSHLEMLMERYPYAPKAKIINLIDLSKERHLSGHTLLSHIVISRMPNGDAIISALAPLIDDPNVCNSDILPWARPSNMTVLEHARARKALSETSDKTKSTALTTAVTHGSAAHVNALLKLKKINIEQVNVEKKTTVEVAISALDKDAKGNETFPLDHPAYNRLESLTILLTYQPKLNKDTFRTAYNNLHAFDPRHYWLYFCLLYLRECTNTISSDSPSMMSLIKYANLLALYEAMVRNIMQLEINRWAIPAAEKTVSDLITRYVHPLENTQPLRLHHYLFNKLSYDHPIWKREPILHAMDDIRDQIQDALAPRAGEGRYQELLKKIDSAIEAVGTDNEEQLQRLYQTL